MVASDGAKHYTKEFYEGFADDSERSARIVLAALFQDVRPQRVVDVGCGTGTWLSAARGLGAQVTRGLDGPWVKTELLRIPAGSFERIDFESATWPLVQPMDLAISLEVAEHLKPETGARLVKFLTQSAPLVLFSAAVPGQGGEGHQNEQWQSYWANLFEGHGFLPSLKLRREFWQDERVEFWYQQNMTLFYGPSHASLFQDPMAAAQMDVIHPRLYDIRVLKPLKRRARLKRFLPFLK